MNERIRRVRKEAGLTQTEFGAKIGIKGNTITNYEKGLRTPSDAVIFSMCREFNIDEHWLRTGEGSPDRKLTPSEEIEKIVRNLLDYSKDSEKNPLYDMIIEMMKDYNELDPDSQAVIKNYCSKVQAGLANNKERLICPSNKLNIDDEVQRYREELELEARQAGKSSAYENTGEINKKQA